MKTIFLSALTNPLGAIEALENVYQHLLVVAERENDLRNYLIASLMLSSLDLAKNMQHRKCASNANKTLTYNYQQAPNFLHVENTDSIEEIMKMRFSFVFNSAVG